MTNQQNNEINETLWQQAEEEVAKNKKDYNEYDVEVVYTNLIHKLK